MSRSRSDGDGSGSRRPGSRRPVWLVPAAEVGAAPRAHLAATGVQAEARRARRGEQESAGQRCWRPADASGAARLRRVGSDSEPRAT